MAAIDPLLPMAIFSVNDRCTLELDLRSGCRQSAYSGERDRRFRHRDRRFRHRDRDSDECDRGVMLRDLILWPSCVFGRFAFAGCQLN